MDEQRPGARDGVHAEQYLQFLWRKAEISQQEIGGEDSNGITDGKERMEVLARILGGLGIICGLIGLGGMCGAIEYGTGFGISVALLILAGVLFRLYLYEDGYLRHKKRTPTDQSKRFFR